MNNKKQSYSKAKTYVLGFIILVVILLVIVLFLIFLNGKTTTSGSNPGIESSKSLICTNNNYTYHIIGENAATKNNIKVSAIFGDEAIDSISLVLSLYYDTSEEISQSEADNHAKMNKSFSSDNMAADSLDATYSKFTDRLQIAFYANGSSLNDNTGKYFLLDNGIPDDISETQKIYEQKGFNCIIKE